MTREDVLKEVLSLSGSNWLLELATGTGKSRMALEKAKSLGGKTLLLVVHRVVHKENWAEEISKWWPNCQMNITVTTYKSLHKYADTYDCAIFDECHHLSELCREYLTNYSIKHSILCSATVKDSLKYQFNIIFKDLTIYTKDLRDVIDEEILPDPKVYLLPLSLRMDTPTVSIWRNPKAKGKLIECPYALRWNFIQQKTHPVRIYCTERQYLCDLNSQVEYWKKRYMATKSPAMKNKWLKLCSDRLKWLSDLKTDMVYELLCHLAGFRTLTFCNSIEQTEVLGKHCINSKNKQSIKVLKDFNEGKIRHITACNMLNEGMNLVNCQIGVYANLNSSETIVKQRMGRLLRHPSPVLIIPYYKDTREEELIREMVKDYNPSLITVVNSISEIKI